MSRSARAGRARLSTTLTRAREVLAVELRRTLLLLLLLDDLLAVVREFIHPHVSRSGLKPLPASS